MFCDRCGKELEAASKFCNSCGKPVGMAVVTPQDGRVNRNVRVLAILWLIYGALRAVGALWYLLVGRVILPAVLSHLPIEPMGIPLGRLIYTVAFFGAALAAFLGIVGLLAAWGLLQREPWARTLSIIAGVVAILSFPFGTALGVFTLWVMLPPSSEEEYQRLIRAA